MLVEVIKKVRELFQKKNLLNYVSMFISVFMLFQILNLYAADYPTIGVIEGYQAETDLTMSGTGDPSYNAQTSAMNTFMGTLNGINQNLNPASLSTYEAIKNNPDLPSYAKTGAIGGVNNAIIAMYNNFEGINVPRYLASEWVPGFDSGSTGVYAASDGFSYLKESNIDALWDRLRLISYVFFVVVLIVAGFMIMFRQKIGGQLAVSVFNVLPNIITALILVTFSFAIVGLLLNFGVMLINVMGSVIGVTADKAITVDSPFSLFSALVTGKINQGFLNSTTFIGSTLAGAVGVIVALMIGTPGVALTAVIAGTVVALFIAIAIAGIVIYASVRVYMTILIAYLGIILNTILAPIYLSISAFPGQGHMATDWLNKILKGVLTFPIVFFFLNLGGFIMSNQMNIGFPSGLMSGDFANVNTADSLVGVAIKFFMAIALFFFAADAPKILDDFLPVNGGKGAMEAIGSMRKGLSKIPMVGSLFA
jgi:hypothetical protein